MKTMFIICCLFCLQADCNQVPTSPAATATPVSYTEIKSKIISEQQRLHDAYLVDGNNKDSLIKVSRAYIFGEITNSLFPAWFGTPWAFNGTTTQPKTDSIACGYFVTTVLRDAGFKIPRVKWAQMASETMILRMTTDIKRYSNVPAEKVIAEIKTRGPGLYVVGLDLHVGFIYYDAKTIQFVHSNYYQPDIGVMAEEPIGVNPFYYSKYRVVGKILDDKMMTAWLAGSAIE